jgi:hypothetical protein
MAILVDDEGNWSIASKFLRCLRRGEVDDQCKENKTLEGKLEGGRWGGLFGNVTMPTPIIIRREAIGEVHDFKYLGSTLTTFEDLEKELSHRWALVTSKFAQLQPI